MNSYIRPQGRAEETKVKSNARIIYCDMEMVAVKTQYIILDAVFSIFRIKARKDATGTERFARETVSRRSRRCNNNYF